MLHRLVERADVFVTHTPLDSRARLGIRWDDLAPLNPRLVYASVTAYGERGEEAPRASRDGRSSDGRHVEHELLLEKAVANRPGARYPWVLGGARACTPEDIGALNLAFHGGWAPRKLDG